MGDNTMHPGGTLDPSSSTPVLLAFRVGEDIPLGEEHNYPHVFGPSITVYTDDTSGI